MDATHLKQLVDLEDTYWWHVAKRKLALRLLEKFAPADGLLIEGGIGSGRNLIAFREAGYDVMGLDLMQESVDHARSRGIDNVQVHDLEQPLPVGDETASAVVVLDVLEHIEHPVAALKNIRQALCDDGVGHSYGAGNPMALQSMGRAIGSLSTLHSSRTSKPRSGSRTPSSMVESLE